MAIPPKNQRKSGYILPEVIDPEDNICICVPIPKDWGHARAFLGQLTELAKWQAWEKDGTTNAAQAARRWFDIATCVAEEIDCAMAEKGCGCGDFPNRIYRHNPDTDRLEQSDDGGETWENAPDPRYDSPVFAPHEGTEEDVKCLSATNATIYFKDELIGQASEWTTLTTVIAGILAVVIGLLTGGLGAALVVELAAAFIGSGIGAAVAAFTPEVYERFKCNLYCHAAADGSWDEAALAAIKNRINVDETGVANTILHGWIDQLGTVGLTNSGRLNLENDVDCSTCEGCEDCANLTNWGVVYGTIIEQTAGYLKMQSGAAGANQSIRLANYTSGEEPECCAVTYTILSGVVQNQAYYPCGAVDPVFSVPPPDTCMYDINLTNIFNVPFTAEFIFEECGV